MLEWDTLGLHITMFVCGTEAKKHERPCCRGCSCISGVHVPCVEGSYIITI